MQFVFTIHSLYSTILICTYCTMLEGINWKEITGINKTRERAVVLLACVRADLNLNACCVHVASDIRQKKRYIIHVSGCLTDHSYKKCTTIWISLYLFSPCDTFENMTKKLHLYLIKTWCKDLYQALFSLFLPCTQNLCV